MADTGQQIRQTGGIRPAAGRAAGPGGDGLIGGNFAVEFDRVLGPLGGGLPAFGVRDRKGRRDGLMAVQVRPGLMPRAQALGVLSSASIPGLSTPVAHGAAAAADGVPGYFVICRTPAGAPLGHAGTIVRRWSEADLLACVLRPAAACLEALAARRITFRAIRPDNLFQAAPGQPVALGQAWAAPPASLQPAVFEPPYVASCLAAGRGDGSIADDVYALGVLLLSLAAGTMPLAGLDAAEVIRRKLAHGSYATLVGEHHVPSLIAELVRGMVAEDPEHRPSPGQLADPDAARSRRVAARPARQALRPLEVDGHAVWSGRALAGALAASPAAATTLLRDGSVDRWLRRVLADATLAARIEEAVRIRATATDGEEAVADGLLVTRAVAALDPLAPVCWRGVAIWPDGLGAALADADSAPLEDLRQLVAAEAFAAWAAARPQRCDPASLRMDARQHRGVVQQRGWAGGIRVLRYALNPLAGCASKRLGRHLVTRLADLLPALEHAAARPDRSDGLPLDAEIAAFIVAREDLRTDPNLAELADPKSPAGAAPGAAALAQLRVLARLQQRMQVPPVPVLAAWLAAELRPALAAWQSRSRRVAIEAAVTAQAARGDLAALLELADDPASRHQDQQEAAAARAASARIDATLASLAGERERRAESAARVSQEVAAALGVIAVSSVALWLAL